MMTDPEHDALRDHFDAAAADIQPSPDLIRRVGAIRPPERRLAALRRSRTFSAAVGALAGAAATVAIMLAVAMPTAPAGPRNQPDPAPPAAGVPNQIDTPSFPGQPQPPTTTPTTVPTTQPTPTTWPQLPTSSMPPTYGATPPGIPQTPTPSGATA